MSNSATAGGTIVQYAQGQDAQFFVPGQYNLNEKCRHKKSLLVPYIHYTFLLL